jgi:hypothetical protein
VPPSPLSVRTQEAFSRGIENIHEHSAARGVQSKLFLVLKRAHRGQNAKMIVQG